MMLKWTNIQKTNSSCKIKVFEIIFVTWQFFNKENLSEYQ